MSTPDLLVDRIPLEQAGPEDCAGACPACPTVGSCADRLVCRCLGVTEDVLIAAIQTHGLVSVKDLKTVTGAGDGCMSCHRELLQYLAVYAVSSANRC